MNHIRLTFILLALSACKPPPCKETIDHPEQHTGSNIQTMQDDHDDHHGHVHPENGDESEDPKEPAARPLDARDHADFGIEIATAKPGTIQKILHLTGEVRMNENTMGHVSPRFSGIVKRIHKRLGDPVEAGEVLAEMESNDTLRPFELTATLNGTITDFHITPGESFEAGELMYTIADTSTVWVDLQMHQRDLPLVHIGQSVLLDFGQNFPPLEAPLSYLGPVVDETTRTGLVRATIPNPNKLLRPGLFAIGELQLDPEPFPVVVSRLSVIPMEDHNIVFISTPEGFVPRTVTTGPQDSTSIAILDGLQPGERYVAKGGFFLKADAQKEDFGDGHAH